MYIFWKYDQYPYLLGGKICDFSPPINFNKRKKYYIPSYGSYFTSELLCSDEKGIELLNKLKKLKEDLRNEEISLKEKYTRLLDETLKNYRS